MAPPGPYDWLVKIIIALVPVLFAALVTLAWQNSHALTRLSTRVDLLDRDMTQLLGVVVQKLGSPKP